MDWEFFTVRLHCVASGIRRGESAVQAVALGFVDAFSGRRLGAFSVTAH